MPEPSQSESKPAVGRTWADATVDIAKLLGGLAPIVILVAGALFALYMFRDQAQRSQGDLRDAREQVIKQNEVERQAASKALQDSYGELRQTYEKMGKLSEQQIGNVKKLLELHGDVATSTDAARERLQKVQEDAARQMKQAEDARMVAEKAKAEAQQAAARKEEAERQSGELERRSRELRRELDQSSERLKREQDKVAGRVSDISRIREQLDQLATAVLRESTTEARGRAEKLLEELREPARVLRAYAANRNSTTSADLKQLAGLSASGLESHLRQGLGYAIWLKGVNKAGGLEAFLGVVQQDESKDEGVVLLEVSKGNISDVGLVDRLLVVATTDVNNWHRKQAYLYLIAGEEVDEDRIIDPGGAKDWTYQLLAEPGERMEVLFGTERRHRFVTPEEFAQQDRRAYERVKQQKDQGGLALQMEERARRFDATKAIGNLSAVQPVPLRDGLVALVNATVRRDESRAREFLGEDSERGLAGRVAALALREGFSVVSSSVEEPRPASPAAQQAPPVGRGAAERAARMVVEHQGQYGSKARSVYRWREVTGGRWVLLAVEPVPAAAK